MNSMEGNEPRSIRSLARFRSHSEIRREAKIKARTAKWEKMFCALRGDKKSRENRTRTSLPRCIHFGHVGHSVRKSAPVIDE